MMRRTFRILPLALLPLFIGIGCAEQRAPADRSEANRSRDEGGAEAPAEAEVEAKEEAKPESPAAGEPPPPAQKPGLRAQGETGAGRSRPMPQAVGPLDERQGDGKRDREKRDREAGAAPPADMFFEHYGVNPTIDTAEAPSSTFAIDVDTASYTMARSYLERGNLPAEAAVRVEEIVNAFDYGYAAPTGETFGIHAEAAPSPNRRGYHVLHVGVKGKEVAAVERKAANLIFVIDVSGSMDQENRLGLVKKSLRLLVDQLEEGDKVGIVTYGSEAKALLPPSDAHDKARIMRVIDGLTTEGATNAEAGLRLGYQMAGQHFRPGAINRVVLLSDGVANVGMTGPQGLVANIIKESKRGITLSTVGVGMGNYNDTLMEQLADKGEGNYHYVDKLDEARRVFVEQLTGTLQVIAKDVKIQLAFDPSAVERYRLIGYENRKLTHEQFDDDRVDAGEVGAGHSVTAIYEVKLREGNGNLGKVRLRYQPPEGGKSLLVEKDLPRSIVRTSADALSSPTQLSLVAAQFAEKLRGSYWARNVSYDDILRRFEHIQAPLRHREDVVGLKRLVERARDIDKRGDKFADKHGPIARMDFDHVPVLR